MKKLLTLLVVFAMILSLCACNSNQAAANPNEAAYKAATEFVKEHAGDVDFEDIEDHQITCTDGVWTVVGDGIQIESGKVDTIDYSITFTLDEAGNYNVITYDIQHTPLN